MPIPKTVEFFDYFKDLGRKSGLQTPTFGHAADGNYHIHFMYDGSNADQKKKAFLAMQKALEKTVELGGAISGEHGVGITKSKYMNLQISDAEFCVMKKIKNALDPNGILNPQLSYTSQIDISQYTQDKDAKLPWDKH